MKSTKKQIEGLADWMDSKAESINAHDFTMTHRALAVLSVKTIGPLTTLALFKALKMELGLMGLTGVCGDEPEGGNILSRVGISENDDEWSLP